jgi:hypothetical protein
MSYRVNCHVADRFSAPPGSSLYHGVAAVHGASYHSQRLNLESALDAGLMDEAADGSILQLANVYPLWHDAPQARFFYAKHTKKRFRVTLPTVPIPPTARFRAFRIRDFAFDERSGFVVLSHAGAAASETGQEIRIFVRHPSLLAEGGVAAFRVEVEPKGIAARTAGPAIGSAGYGLSLIRSGSDWRLFSLKNADGKLAPDSLHVVFGEKANEPIVWVSPGPVAIHDSAGVGR